MTVKGNSMEPLITNGSKVWLHHNYYRCGGEVLRGDIVAFRNAVEEIPLIKRVCATAEDEVAILPGGLLLVNGDTLRNSAGRLYQFTHGQSNMIRMYIRNGHIPGGTYLMFGDNVNISRDSRNFGVCSDKSIIGKFELSPPVVD
jgi:signal peptidase I